MIALIERLIERGKAYVAGGNVYFEVSSFPPYGCLSGNSVEDLIAGARVEIDEFKRSPADFALWKAAGPEKLMRFESPWGMGVPGWHIECSAMAFELLGEEIDIHTGGIDHIFPHHEDEIAQSEGATGRRFARVWMHNDFLQIAGEEKMSKSLGNIYTVSDLEKQGIHPLSFRYFTFQARYSTPLNFTFEAGRGAHTALTRVWEAAAELYQSGVCVPLTTDGDAYRCRFHEAINRDLDLPVAIASVHDVLASCLPPGEKPQDRTTSQSDKRARGRANEPPDTAEGRKRQHKEDAARQVFWPGAVRGQICRRETDRDRRTDDRATKPTGHGGEQRHPLRMAGGSPAYRRTNHKAD